MLRPGCACTRASLPKRCAIPSQPLELSVAAQPRGAHLVYRRHAHDGLLGGEVERAADDVDLLLATAALVAGEVRWVLTHMDDLHAQAKR